MVLETAGGVHIAEEDTLWVSGGTKYPLTGTRAPSHYLRWSSEPVNGYFQVIFCAKPVPTTVSSIKYHGVK